MTLEGIASVATLALLISALRVILPRALRERDALALTAAVATVVLAFLGWALIGVAVR